MVIERVVQVAKVEGFIDVSQILRSGVYALAHKGQVVYIGKSKTMLVRIYSHRSAWGQRAKSPSWLPVKGILFDEVFIRPCSLEVIDQLEYEMINLYKPKHNQLLKSWGPTRVPFSIEVKGMPLAFNPVRPTVERRI